MKEIIQNRKVVISLIVMALLFISGTVVLAERFNRNQAISVENARNFAFIDANVSQEEVLEIEEELETDSKGTYYSIEFETAKGEYDYEIDAKSGKVLQKEVELRTGAAANAPTDPTKGNPPAAPSTSPAPAAPSTSPAPAAPSASPAPAASSASPAPAASSIQQDGIEAAKQLAVRHAGLSMADVTFDKAKKEYDDGRDIYEIEFYVYGVAEYEYEIDANTGQILDFESDEWDD
ncbi:MAG: PepSY domain-containing protein [Lachnospiraceae bacterium]|nr:PepSY domain-containing protein [Lachnospiraceae bacterium]